MEIISSLLNEIIPEIFFSLLHTLTLGLILDLVTHVLLLFLIEKRRHHADGQQVVDQFQEALLEDMCVSEEEKHWALGQHPQKILEVLSELFLLVSSC